MTMTALDQEVIAVHAAEEQLRAQIRDAAIAKIGAQGFRTPIRAIAAAAGLSADVVIDLYGSKRNLLKACDDHVVETIRTSKSQALQSRDPATWRAALAGIESYAPLMAYLVRSIEDGQSLADGLLDRMIENVIDYLDDGVRAGTVKPSRNPRARAKFLALSNAGGFLLYRHRHPTPRDMAAVLRDYAADMIEPALELYSSGLMADTTMLDALAEPLARQRNGAHHRSLVPPASPDSTVNVPPTSPAR
ncbi:transcriptional regulator, TetR family [Mycolicibacterium vanbaalenii PYR-1]|jgi:AcrR family transcriptional regulator|uniref:Transcriptional regulator, TetR family n=2 Tax=Mycolicibacterium vanbaalenii TaxID=110539 RepID=A1T4Y0_MYCVP|nr:transcriptional regulator, TetR family [Mycolicibacterium vanbaalenii PYR-1]